MVWPASRPFRGYVLAVVFALAVLRGRPAWPFAAIPLGGEFQVNGYTQSTQFLAAVAPAAGGSFLVAWASYGRDGDHYGIFGRRFDSTGAALAAEFQVNTRTVAEQLRPSVAADGAGNFVVVWDGATDGGGFGVFGQRFDSSGGRLGVEFQVNTYTPNTQAVGRVAMSTQGSFVVAWSSLYQDDYQEGIFAQRFASSGARLAVEFQVNTTTFAAQFVPDLAMDASGSFVVVWSSEHDGSGEGIFGRRFDASGAPLGPEFQANTYTIDQQIGPAVAMDDDGAFVVVWSSYQQEGVSSLFGVFSQRFDAMGAPLDGEFQVNTRLDQYEVAPDVAFGAAGAFVIAWTAIGPAIDDDAGVFARRFGSNGDASGFEFHVNTYTQAAQANPRLASSGNRFVAVWASTGQDGGARGVFGQRFTAVATLDIDADGLVTPLTDGLLVLRFLFGFTGAPLVNQAVGADCARCNSVAIASYLTEIQALLDVDDDHDLNALTDGLLVLRFLFGFTGATLTNGALGDMCARCDADAIVRYLQPMVV